MPAFDRQKGVTLVELIVGLVITGITLAALSVVFFSAPQRSVEPVLQIRAAELGQSLMQEILAKPYDEQTPVGGLPACSSCTLAADFGADAGESRPGYDDVDDYHSYCRSAAPYASVIDPFGVTPDDFEDFRMSVCVVYDGNFDGVADSDQRAKQITVDVYPPPVSGQRQRLRFLAWRSNF